MGSGVTFGQLPDEVPSFIAYLQKTGDVWARAVKDDPLHPNYPPLPVSEFLQRYADQIVDHHCVDVYLAFREDIFHPVIARQEVIEGGTLVPFIQSGKVVQGVHSIVEGTKVERNFIDPNASLFVRYQSGRFRNEYELASSNLGFNPGTFIDRQWVPNSPAFVKWGTKILNWMRRQTPESVPVYRCNYEMRATIRVAEACRKGMKLGVRAARVSAAVRIRTSRSSPAHELGGGVAGRVAREHPRDSVARDVGKRDGYGDTRAIQHLEMQVRKHAEPDIATRRDDLSALDAAANRDVAAVAFQVEVPPFGAVAVIDHDLVVRHGRPIPVVRDINDHHRAAPSCANVGADRHHEVVREFFPVPMADNGAIPLHAKMPNARAPWQPVR